MMLNPLFQCHRKPNVILCRRLCSLGKDTSGRVRGNAHPCMRAIDCCDNDMCIISGGHYGKARTVGPS